jgi:hypothetical protein
MLRIADSLRKYVLTAVDGEIGQFDDFFFDDMHWTIRYIVADTGEWIRESLVLISPYSIRSLQEDSKLIETNMTVEQIEKAPKIDSGEQMSRQFEVAYNMYYGWPHYWAEPGVWGASAIPMPMTPRIGESPEASEAGWNADLHSGREAEGFHIIASDGEVGHVAGFILDDIDWTIRYFVIDTKNWWPGKHVLLAPHWAGRVDWGEQQVHVDISRDVIREAPPFDPHSFVTRDYEAQLCTYYHKDAYWTGTDCATKPK